MYLFHKKRELKQSKVNVRGQYKAEKEKNKTATKKQHKNLRNNICFAVHQMSQLQDSISAMIDHLCLSHHVSCFSLNNLNKKKKKKKKNE